MSHIDFEDLKLETNSKVLNNVFEMLHVFLVRYLKSYENGYGSLINTFLSEFNLLLRAHSNFYIPWPDQMHHRFNTTFTTVPEIDADK